MKKELFANAEILPVVLVNLLQLVTKKIVSANAEILPLASSILGPQPVTWMKINADVEMILLVAQHRISV